MLQLQWAQQRGLLLTVFGRRWALWRVGAQMVPGVAVLVHRRERVRPQSGARVHCGVVMARRPSCWLGPTLVEVVRRRVVVLAVSRRCCRRPADGVISHPRVLLQLDERRLVDTSDASSGVGGRRGVRGRRRVLVRRRRQATATRQVVMVVMVVGGAVQSVRRRHASCRRRCV